MRVTLKSLLELFKLKLQFGFASLLATGIDYTVFLLLIWLDFDAVKAHYVSATMGMLVNFLVQNQYVFLRERALLTTFLLSMTVSVIGIVLGGFLMGWIQQFPFWNAHLYLAKIVVTGLIFFYNFYLKRFVFEKRFL
jgi:putative flippase GtrA